jgi:hypothetical protein
MKPFSASSPIGLMAVAFVFTFAIHSPASFAAPDSFEDYRLQQQQGAQKIKAEFQEYKENQDREFSNFLKSQWSEFETFQGKVRIKEPKPKQIPVVVPAAQPAPSKPIPVPVPVVPKAVPDAKAKPAPITPAPQPVITPPVIAPVVIAPVIAPPPPPQPEPVPVAADMLELSFYGNTVSFHFDPKWKKYRLPNGDKPEAMSAFWTMMSGSNYGPAIESVNAARRELKLDDWGSVALWRNVVQALQPERKAEQNLLLWYFLVKSGYNVRLGYAGSDVHLFVAVKQQVFSTKFTKVGQQTYYAVLAADHGDSIGSFYTYEASYPVKLNPLDIASASTGFTKPVTAQRAVSFAYKGETIKLNVPYDRQLVQYLGSFPQSEFEIYFDTNGSQLVRQSLLAELKKYTATMSEEEAINFLLTFVQKAFAYKTDEEQFGYEKYFFVEELFFFPYSDCEDRAVLFAWLAHELTGVKMVGLLYPGHMTTGVALKQVKPGFSTVDYKGSRFVIADPTYIGASVGMAMPFYAKLKPTRVVEIQ